MSDWLNEIQVVAENSSPIPFEEAFKCNNDGKKFVFIFPTWLRADIAFDRYRTLFAPPLVKRMRRHRILLQNDAELIFLCEDAVEKGQALRGLGKVVWCE